jgi:hypothetical protein
MEATHTKGYPRFLQIISISLTILVFIFSGYQFTQASNTSGFLLQPPLFPEESDSSQVFLPIIQTPPLKLSRINIPYFDGSEVNYHEAAVSWFGQVRENENYADIRVGYTSNLIYVRVSVFDNYLWYDTNPDIYNLTEWDAVTLYLDIEGNNGNELGSTRFNFTRQLQWWDDGLNRQIAYQGSNLGWNEVPLYFRTSYGWQGNAPNDSVLDRGYALDFYIPFASLGYTSAPPEGTKWGAAITMYDRDDADGVNISKKYWPKNFNQSRSATWGQFSFGIPSYTPPQANNPQVFTLRNGLNGITVTDGIVGGGTECGGSSGGPPNFWSLWGDFSDPLAAYMNIQNEGLLYDWPCFSKFYITFPLDSLPDGQTVVSATLTLHQAGQSTGFPEDPPEALNSLIQVSVIDQAWDENTLTWNNGPIPIENVSRSWVGYITDDPDLGKASNWDLSSAVVNAYSAREPLRLVLYSADNYGSNGKYFFSSDQDWEIMRPSLTVELGEP